MNEAELKAFQENFLKELGITMDSIMEEKLTEKLKKINADSEKTIEDMKEEIKKISKSLEKPNFKGEDDEAKAKSVVVNTFKKVKELGISSEQAFEKIFQDEVKATYQNEGTAGEGAEFVFDIFAKNVYAIFEQFELVKELDPLTIKGKSITLPRYDWWTEAYWIDEGWNFTSSKGWTWNIKIDIYKLGALVSFTEEMLDDDMSNEQLFKLIVKEIWVKFAWKIEDEVLNWTGGKMEGILTNSDVKVITSSATAYADITEGDILDADALIDEKYDINPNNKVAVMLKSTFNKLRQKRDANGNLLYPELRLGKGKRTLFDYRVILSSKMPVEDSGKVWILLGNIKDFYYYILRKEFTAEMGLLADDFKTGKKSLRVDKRVGWKVKDWKAFAVVKIS